MGFAGSTVAGWLRPLGLVPQKLDPATLPIRKAWKHMIRSCRDPSYRGYRLLRPVGKDVTREWEQYAEFQKWSLENGWKPGRVFTRVDVARGFSPANCRWETRRRPRQPWTPKRIVRAFGERKGVGEWSRDRRCRVSLRTLYSRLNRRWPPEEAIALPLSSGPSRLLRRPAGAVGAQKRHVVDWDELAWQYSDAGKSVSRLASETGISARTIHGRFRKAGIIRPRSRRSTPIRPEALYLKWRWIRARARWLRQRGEPFEVAAEWSDYAAFREWALTHGYRAGLSLVRKDPNGDWEPLNCQFVSRARASGYHRRKPAKKERPPRWTLKAFGEEKGLTAWARDPRCAVTAPAVRRRLEKGWKSEDAITEPPAYPGLSGHVFHRVRAFGETKSVTDWARDRRCKVTLGGLQGRLKRGVAAEVAIRTPSWECVPTDGARSRRRRAR